MFCLCELYWEFTMELDIVLTYVLNFLTETTVGVAST